MEMSRDSRDGARALSPAHVFISHSTKDAGIARAACKELEGAGIGCWIAPRDIVPGQTWSGAIVAGIDVSRVLLVVFSSHANASPEVVREVELASRKRKPLLALRVEDVAPSGDLAYFLSATQWLDAFPPPLQPRLAQLVTVVTTLLGLERPAAPVDPVPEDDFVEVDLDDFGQSGGRRAGIVDRLFRDR
jgi:TIR domain